VLDLLVGDVVEHEELGLRTEIGHIGDPARDQMLLGLVGHEPGIASVRLAQHRVGHRTDQRQRPARVIGVDERGR
jgi:hypothetical protein